MRIVVACPSALADGEKIRQEMGAALCPYMALIRDVLPPTTMNDTLVWTEASPIRSRMWVVAQVWDIADTILAAFRKQVDEGEFALLPMNTDIGRYIIPNAGTTPAPRGTGRGTAGYTIATTVPGVRGSPYIVARYPTNMETHLYTNGLAPAFPGNTVFCYPQRKGVYTTRTYREDVDINLAVSDVMGRITENIKGNI